MTSPPTSTNTAGGAHIGESVTAGGDFIGRDQVNITIHQTLPGAPVVDLPASDLYLLNFARPLTSVQRSQIEQALGYGIGKTINLPTEFDNLRDFGPQCVALAGEVGLTSHEWQTLPILVNAPGFAPGALCLLSELHGRMGHFPALVRLCPRPHCNPPIYDVAELINLQALRDAARRRG
ncbi:hypothetical protein BH10CHL1_BH10CHL1_50270 [soil metagenome]